MSSLFTLLGSYQATPPVRSTTETTDVGQAFELRALLTRKHYDEIDILSNSPVTVAFGGVTNAHYVVIQSDQKVQVKLTSTDGAAQIVPVDNLLILSAYLVPITAITLVRLAGVDTRVKVFLGESQ